MPVLDRIAYYQNRRDEAPNQALARELVAARDTRGIREIAKNLCNTNPSVASDCLKVLYEIGYLEPKLIVTYADDFVELLTSKNNRMVWGSMLALASIATAAPKKLVPHLSAIEHATDSGSVITRDNGIKTLAQLAAGDTAARRKIFPYLMHTLATCRPKETPMYAEHTLVAVGPKQRAEFERVLTKRLPDMPASRAARVRRVLKQLDAPPKRKK